MNNSPEWAQGSANSKTPLTDKFYGCPPPESGKDWQTRGTRQERDFARQLERQLAQSEERVAKFQREALKALDEVAEAGRWGIDHVGAANYRERQIEATDNLDKALDEQRAALLSSSKTN